MLRVWGWRKEGEAWCSMYGVDWRRGKEQDTSTFTQWAVPAKGFLVVCIRQDIVHTPLQLGVSMFGDPFEKNDSKKDTFTFSTFRVSSVGVRRAQLPARGSLL